MTDTKIKINAIKYPSTNQFRNVCQHMIHSCQSVYNEAENRWDVDRNKPLPTVRFAGTVKVHGTNGSMVKYADGRIYFQSKSRILDITHDNMGFFEAMSTVDVNQLFDQFIQQYVGLHGVEPDYPIEIAGEWAGDGIQKGVSVSQVPKFFAIFAIRTGEQVSDDGKLVGWHNITHYADIELPDDRIFNICRFGVEYIYINFENPKASTHALEASTLAVEQECPVGKYFGVSGIGEGKVWSPVDSVYMGSPSSWFKCKGTKHSVSKVTTLVSVDPETIHNINEFVEYAATANRLEQGVGEIGLDMKLVGKYLGWVNSDIFKEEADTLKANGLTMKDVGRKISDRARTYYLAKVKLQDGL